MCPSWLCDGRLRNQNPLGTGLPESTEVLEVRSFTRIVSIFSLPLRRPINLLFCPSVHLFACMSGYLSVCLSVLLSALLCIRLFVCFCFHHFVCLYVCW